MNMLMNSIATSTNWNQSTPFSTT